MTENLHPEPTMLRDMLVFLMAAIIVVPLFQKLRANPVIGYLLAGALVGPYGFALIREVEGSHRLAEYGIVFMLFLIGLELSLERLKAMARYVFGLGLAQVAVTGAAIASIALLFGAEYGQAAVIGGALALSSTAFALQILTDRGELHTRLGRIVLAILLMQDLAVVPGIAVVTALGQEADELAWSLALAALKALAAMVLLLGVGRLVLRPLYRVIAAAQSPELFAAATLLVVLGTAFATEQAGLSMALGAFLAGLTLAGTEFRHQIEADVKPIRGILLGLFFISVGMLINPAVVAAQLPAILALVAALVAVKAAILVLLSRLAGVSWPLSVNVGLHLAEGGEFAFVLFSLAMTAGVIDADLGQVLLAAVALSMALTPLLAAAGRVARTRLERGLQPGADAISIDTEHQSGHVIIGGFGRVGRTIARMLDEQDIAWVAIDHDASNIRAARDKGLPVYFGDAGRREVLDAAGVERAGAAVITMNDPKAAAGAVRALRARLPDLPVLVRARDPGHMRELLAAGASTALPETTEASLMLGGAVLRVLGAGPETADRIVELFRQDAYAPVRDLDTSAAEGTGIVEPADASPRVADKST
jgi:CPA2 family monovalent cation:H+ antiporter-2